MIFKTLPRPGLNGALFVERSGAKKREWKTETGAQKKLNFNGLVLKQTFKQKK